MDRCPFCGVHAAWHPAGRCGKKRPISEVAAALAAVQGIPVDTEATDG